MWFKVSFPASSSADLKVPVNQDTSVMSGLSRSRVILPKSWNCLLIKCLAKAASGVETTQFLNKARLCSHPIVFYVLCSKGNKPGPEWWGKGLYGAQRLALGLIGECKWKHKTGVSHTYLAPLVTWCELYERRQNNWVLRWSNEWEDDKWVGRSFARGNSLSDTTKEECCTILKSMADV